jgi:Ser/Thr protein kinase RdoA (MazF antagonist)
VTDDAPYADLGPDTVLDAVEATGRLSDARLLPLNSYENRVWQVGLEDAEPVVVKFYRPKRWTDAAILEEHAFTAGLAELEIPAVPPLEDDGTTLHVHADLRYAIYPRRGGRAPDTEDPDALHVLGRYLGRIHAVGTLRPFEHRPDLTVADFGHASRTFLLESDFVPEELREAFDTLTADLLERIEQDFPALDAFGAIRLHGDCHMGNVLWRDEVPHFVDFDDARMGPAVQDLWMLLSGERDERLRQLSEVVDGYDEFFDFDPRQLVLIEPLRTLRILHHSAWIGRRWNDPAFPRAFPFFTSQRYWSDQVLALREQYAALQEPPLTLQ